MKKKDSSFERISAMLIKDSLCSNEKYKGPLFARKKERNYRLFIYTVVLIAVTIFVWEKGRANAPKIMAGVSQIFNSRSLASDKK